MFTEEPEGWDWYLVEPVEVIVFGIVAVFIDEGICGDPIGKWESHSKNSMRLTEFACLASFFEVFTEDVLFFGVVEE
jgi:hypothetical protein